MPELLTQPKTPKIPNRWPELNRNGGRLQIGTVADFTSEYPAGFNRNPHPEVNKVVRWRCADLREQVARRFSVDATERTISRWLRQLKLTRLQPRPFHPKKDLAAQEAFKKISAA